MISPEGLLNGLSATFCFFFALTLGVVIIYNARKLRARLLFYMGINVVLAGMFWSYKSLDFMSIVLTGSNLINEQNYIFYGIVSWMWTPIVLLISLYIFCELVDPSKIWHFVSIFGFLALLYELILFTNPSGSLTLNEPSILGTDVMDIELSDNHIFMFSITFVFLLSGMIFCGFGFLWKATKETALVKKKFLFLSSGYFIFTGFPVIFNYIVQNPILNLIYRIGMATSFLFFYFGLREEKEQKLRPTKKIDIRESLFRLSKVEFDLVDKYDWRQSLLHINVVQKSGMTLYSQELRPKTPIIDDYLLGGILTAVSYLLKELSSQKKPLKLIEQEQFSILIEEGENIFVVVIALQEHPIIRQKMKAFLSDFQKAFKDILNDKVPKPKLFLSTHALVSKHFNHHLVVEQ
ncbi:MAG: hypothetical protein JW891_17720 [Candidatus Lokiarchaeota archaeon]|nr:hypothetical protein [Candidatus Lokiarchaeota archaeon]